MIGRDWLQFPLMVACIGSMRDHADVCPYDSVVTVKMTRPCGHSWLYRLCAGHGESEVGTVGPYSECYDCGESGQPSIELAEAMYQ